MLLLRLGLFTLLTLLLVPLALAQTTPFAALQITPYGDQAVDLATGVTTLPQGGEIVDEESGVTLTGSLVTYKEGDYVEVTDGEVTGDFGSLAAPTVRLDINAQTLETTGGVRFEGEGLALQSDMLTLYLEPDIAVAAGGLTSETPALEAAALLVDLQQNAALVVGPYHYQNGPLTLQSEAEDLLGLTWGADETDFEASTTIDPALQTRLEPYLP